MPDIKQNKIFAPIETIALDSLNIILSQLGPAEITRLSSASSSLFHQINFREKLWTSYILQFSAEQQYELLLRFIIQLIDHPEKMPLLAFPPHARGLQHYWQYLDTLPADSALLFKRKLAAIALRLILNIKIFSPNIYGNPEIRHLTKQFLNYAKWGIRTEIILVKIFFISICLVANIAYDPSYIIEYSGKHNYSLVEQCVIESIYRKFNPLASSQAQAYLHKKKLFFKADSSLPLFCFFEQPIHALSLNTQRQLWHQLWEYILQAQHRHDAFAFLEISVWIDLFSPVIPFQKNHLTKEDDQKNILWAITNILQFFPDNISPNNQLIYFYARVILFTLRADLSLRKSQSKNSRMLLFEIWIPYMFPQVLFILGSEQTIDRQVITALKTCFDCFTDQETKTIALAFLRLNTPKIIKLSAYFLQEILLTAFKKIKFDSTSSLIANSKLVAFTAPNLLLPYQIVALQDTLDQGDSFYIIAYLLIKNLLILSSKDTNLEAYLLQTVTTRQDAEAEDVALLLHLLCQKIQRPESLNTVLLWLEKHPILAGQILPALQHNVAYTQIKKAIPHLLPKIQQFLRQSPPSHTEWTAWVFFKETFALTVEAAEEKTTQAIFDLLPFIWQEIRLLRVFYHAEKEILTLPIWQKELIDIILNNLQAIPAAHLPNETYEDLLILLSKIKNVTFDNVTEFLTEALQHIDPTRWPAFMVAHAEKIGDMPLSKIWASYGKPLTTPMQEAFAAFLKAQATQLNPEPVITTLSAS